MGAPVVNGHVVSSFQPPFICKTSSGGTNAEGWFKSSLGSMTERGMRGCSVIVNRLIDNAFWLICKDERKRRNDRLCEGGSIFPYIKNMPSFLKKMVMFLRNITIFLENIKVFLPTHRATHTVASGHTYIRIELHVRTHEPARIYVRLRHIGLAKYG